MKHTDFYSLTQQIKKQEYSELFKAVETHGGNYEWGEDEESPIVAINPDSACPNPTDVKISRVYIEGGKLNILGTDKESGDDIEFEPEDAFAGHLSDVIDYIPEINGVEDVSTPKTKRVENLLGLLIQNKIDYLQFSQVFQSSFGEITGIGINGFDINDGENMGVLNELDDDEINRLIDAVELQISNQRESVH